MFEFSTPDDLVEYWRKLLHISMNTYKFSVGKDLHEDKRLRQNLLNKITTKSELSSIKDLWEIENYGDSMGPGGYDSQLFLNSYKNWMLPNNVSSISSSTSRRSKKSNAELESNEPPAITKDADRTFAPFSELALVLPFGVFRQVESTSRRRKPLKRKANDSELNAEKVAKPKPSKKRKKETPVLFKAQLNTRKALMIKKAKQLIDKAKTFKPISASAQAHDHQAANESLIERRAIWHADEDEMVTLFFSCCIKIAF